MSLVQIRPLFSSESLSEMNKRCSSALRLLRGCRCGRIVAAGHKHTQHTTHNTPTPTTPPGPAGTDLNILSVSSDTQVEVTPVLRGSTYSQSQGLTAAVNKHGVRGGLSAAAPPEEGREEEVNKVKKRRRRRFIPHTSNNTTCSRSFYCFSVSDFSSLVPFSPDGAVSPHVPQSSVL